MDSPKALYLYGIVNQYDLIDQPDSRSVLEELKSPEQIRLLPIREFAALVSEVSLEEFGEETLKHRLKDAKWLEYRLRHHEWVVEMFMRCGTVIPMKFATIFSTEERLCERLLALYEMLRELWGKLQGKEEWGVKAFCDLRYIRASAEAEHEKIAQLKAQLAGQPPGTAYLMKKQLEELVTRETDQLLSRHLESIYQRLASLAHEAKLNLLTPHELIPPPVYPPKADQGNDEGDRPSGPKTGGGMTTRKHEMVLNAALLLEKTSVNRLAEGVRALRQDYAPHGFEFESIGPFPPYNFSKLPQDAATHG
ncbi:MAG: GvpL/GvpF family gas vesicle protein [Candidatus Omnitrophica bacterium]|nr:GvpL/GvpF family gas vesicle protein [Candidatus Omnitrophota bacterium]